MDFSTTLTNCIAIPLVLMLRLIYLLLGKLTGKFYELFPEFGLQVSTALGTIHGKGTHENVMITFPYSHYCEKVRWAFQQSGEILEEYGNGPVFHFSGIYHSSGRGTTLPVLITKENKLITESTDCLRYVHELNKQKSIPNNDWLFPSKEVDDLEKYFTNDFGRPAFGVAYAFLTRETVGQECLTKVWNIGIPDWQKKLLPVFCPLALMMMKKGMNKVFVDNYKEVDKAFERVDQILKDGRKYLGNTAVPSAADIAFASLAFPLILPPEMDNRYLSYNHDKLPDEYKQEIEKRRKTPAGKFILRIYAEDRYRCSTVAVLS